MSLYSHRNIQVLRELGHISFNFHYASITPTNGFHRLFTPGLRSTYRHEEYANPCIYGLRAWIPTGLRNDVGFSEFRNGFRAYNASSDLAAKKCVPCSSKDLQPMNEEVANDMITKVPGWIVVTEDAKLKIRQTWKVKSFMKGLDFFKLVADVAEAEGHHPDLHLVGWNNVTIQIWTHAVGGLTENDFILAAKINALDFASLLKRKPAN